MFFAIATGMVYRRFSRPSARILFSNNALISPYKDGTALMFRIVNRRPNVLMEVEARVMLALDMDEGEETMRRYFNLKLETTSIHFFPLSWTIVHPIDDTSPMQNLSAEDMFRKKAEVLILMKAFDETFSQHVHVKFSYTADEIVWNARFIRNFKANTTGEIELDIDAVHDYEKLD
jgi:inward rectifier potassium channel